MVVVVDAEPVELILNVDTEVELSETTFGVQNLEVEVMAIFVEILEFKFVVTTVVELDFSVVGKDKFEIE